MMIYLQRNVTNVASIVRFTFRGVASLSRNRLWAVLLILAPDRLNSRRSHVAYGLHGELDLNSNMLNRYIGRYRGMQ